MDYPKLKVTELKEILTSRGLSTKGVKAELIARLEEDDATSAAPVAQEEEEAEVQIPSEEPAQEDVNAKVDETAAAAPAQVSELTPRPHPQASELMKQTAEAEAVVETLEAQDEVEIRAEQEEGTGPESATKSPVEDAPPSLTSRLGAQEEMKEDKPAQQQGGEGGPSMLSAIASAHSAGVEAIVPGGSSSVSPLQVESASTSEPKAPRKAAKGAAPLASLAPPHPPTRALRVTGLVRPMMLPSLKEMLREKFGQLDEGEDVKGGVWLDGIKSAGWIVFKEVSSAQQLLEAFNSKPFPSADSFRTPVSFFYVPAEHVPRLLQEEENFWEKERGRMEIVATTSQPAEGEGEREYEYSARPVRQQKKIRDPKPPPPSATAAHSSTAGAGGQGLSIRGSGFNKRAGAGANGTSTAADPLVDASSLPPVSFPPVRSPKQDRSRDDGRGRGSRAEARYQPYPPADVRDRDDRSALPAPIADYAKAAAPSSAAGPLRDAQTELEISRSRDAAASAYAGRGGRGPSGAPSAASDSRRDEYGAPRGGYEHERGGRGYDRAGGGGGGGYGYRGVYERYDERDRDGRRRGYDYDYDYDYDRRAPPPSGPGPAARDERGYSSRSNGHAGGFRDGGKVVRGASPGWMGERAPPPSAAAGGEDRREAHGRNRDRDRDRERDRHDRPSASRDDHAGGRGGRGGGGGGGGRDRDRGKRDRSPRGARAGAGEEDRYVPRARNERD